MKKNINLKLYLLAFVLFITSFCLMNPKVYAKTMTSEEIKGPAYVIGSHMFTRDINKETGYDGKLTTNLIMLASKTIEAEGLDDMIIYYKTATGMWINGLTGNKIEVPTSFEINYINLQLEKVDSEVSAPKDPILYLDGPLSFNNSMMSYQLNIYIDDILDTSNKVDGVELTIVKNGVAESQDLKYNENFKQETTINNLDSYESVEDLVVGNTYHTSFLTVENKVDGYMSIGAKAYVLDKNGEKVYSDSVFVFADPDTNFKVPTIVNKYSNPDYIKKDENFYTYRLGIEEPKAYVFKVEPQRFGYVLYEKGENINRQIGVYKLSEQAIISVPKNNVKVYYAQLGYYDDLGQFHFYSQDRLNYFTIDTRNLTAPVLDGNQEGMAFSDLKENGEYLRINSDFYKNQGEDTLDYKMEGTEIYRLSFTSDGEKEYELIEERFPFAHVFTPTGVSYYLARVYATNAEGYKVYSDFSNIVTVIRTPEITVSKVKDGKIDLTIANKEEYSASLNYNIYTLDSKGDEVLLEKHNLNDGKISVDVSEGMKLYVRVYDKDYNSSGMSPNYVYSANSNVVDINIK